MPSGPACNCTFLKPSDEADHAATLYARFSMPSSTSCILAVPGGICRAIFLAFQTVFYHFRQFSRKGTWVRLLQDLHQAERCRVGRDPHPSVAILEVGCGPGTDVFALVDLVGPAGRLVGLDASEVMIAEARRRAQQLQVRVTFEVGEVDALPSPTAPSMCVAPRLLEHVPDAEQALAEMVRVTRANACWSRRDRGELAELARRRRVQPGRPAVPHWSQRDD
jgi:SAM-dependent methyltransferase